MTPETLIHFSLLALAGGAAFCIWEQLLLWKIDRDARKIATRHHNEELGRIE